MVWDYAETNPFNSIGANWLAAIDAAYDTVTGISNGADSPAHVAQGSATRLDYGNESFDAIITDPPYYDAVPYADLSDFFYVWLKRTIGDLYPVLLSTPLTPKSVEIIQEPGRFDGDSDAAKQFYELHMRLRRLSAP